MDWSCHTRRVEVVLGVRVWVGGGLAAYMMARYLPNRAALCGGQAARRRPAASHQTTLYFAV